MNQNEALLQAVVRGTEMGKNTLDQLMPAASDPALKAEMLRQQNAYRSLNQQAHTALDALGTKAEGIGTMARLATKMSVAGEVRRDRSPRHLAQMIIEGSAMGVSDCTSAQRDCPDASNGAKQLAQKLCSLEAEGAYNLRQFL